MAVVYFHPQRGKLKDSGLQLYKVFLRQSSVCLSSIIPLLIENMSDKKSPFFFLLLFLCTDSVSWMANQSDSCWQRLTRSNGTEHIAKPWATEAQWYARQSTVSLMCQSPRIEHTEPQRGNVVWSECNINRHIRIKCLHTTQRLQRFCLCTGKRPCHNSEQAQSLLVRLPGVWLQCDTSGGQSLFLEASQTRTAEADKDVCYGSHIMMLPIFHG